MIGLALSGGGSRAMAFHLGCLRALDDLGILEYIDVLSTISGGSVIGAYYGYTPHLTFEEFESDIRRFLRRGFQIKIAWELAKPWNLLPCIASTIATSAEAGALLIGKWRPRLRRYRSRTDIFNQVLHRQLFGDLKMSSPRRNGMEVLIGSSELRTGAAFRFGTRASGNGRLGEMVEGDVDVSFAVTASAAYPIFLPSLDRVWNFRKDGQENMHRVLLSDGGIYDNLGIQVIEPSRDQRFSLHTFPCDYLIVCNAGQGQESGDATPTWFYPRVKGSFVMTHRRVQDSSMHLLHYLKEAGLIKGFALPYLGQQDQQLPWKPNPLVPRSDVIGYPTDFAAMSEKWIDRLSNRGEQLTRMLVSTYLPELLE